MKKIYFLLLVFLSAGSGIMAQQCTIDNSDTTLGLTPPDSLIPPVIRNQAYSTVVQVYVPATFTVDTSVSHLPFAITVNIVWIAIDTITAAPTGISYLANPAPPANDTLYGNSHACYTIFGTTSDTTGVYKLNFSGYIRFNTALLNGGQDTTMNLSALQALPVSLGPAAQFAPVLRVQNSLGINAVNAQLSSALQVVPNPNNGQFDIKMNYNGELTGDIKILDATGRVVYNQPMSSRGLYTNTINLGNLAKGIYAVQLTTPEGVASKLVSVE